MRPIKLDDKEKQALLEKFTASLIHQLDNYVFFDGSKFTFVSEIGEKAKDKVTIMYSPSAYLRMQALVKNFSSEVSWFGLVDRLSEKEFYVYDVLICRQQVSGAKVDTNDEDMLEFITSLTEDESEHMHFQAHSHVNMDTGASETDMQNQEDIVNSMPGHTGFYIFQIWNKKGDINTYLYDLDNNIMYDKKDVELVVEDSLGTLDDFIDDAEELVEKYTPKTQYSGKPQYGGYADYYDNYQVKGKYSYYNYGYQDWGGE